MFQSYLVTFRWWRGLRVLYVHRSVSGSELNPMAIGSDHRSVRCVRGPSLPIGHSSEIALTRTFAIGGVRWQRPIGSFGGRPRER